jgi:hypothetical protein
MKVLSWDVGIKNLAYCILSFENDKWIIHEWDIINLSVDENSIKLECWMCKKKPSYQYKTDKEHYICGKHKSLYKQKDIVFEDEFTNDVTQTKCLNISCKIKPKYKLNGLDNYYCTAHAKAYIKKKTSEERLVKISKNKSVMKISVKKLLTELFNRLDKLPELLQCDKVLIENQPVQMNPTMKTMAIAIYSYFTIRGIVDKSKTKSSIEDVDFACPSNKLKLNEKNTLEVLDKTEDGQKYKMTKNLGIEYCIKMISHDEKNLNKLKSYKKKDDLCDAFLQGAYRLVKV